MKHEDNIEISWDKATLLLIPLCFIVDYIVDLGGNDEGDSVVFILVIFSYSLFFFLRRNATPTLLSLVAFYIISIIGAGIIALSDTVLLVMGVIFLLDTSLAYTMVVTKKGDEVYSKIDEEEKHQKGIEKLIATPTQQKENGKWIIDFIIFIVVGVVFLLLRDHFIERHEMIQKGNIAVKEQTQVIYNKDINVSDYQVPDFLTKSFHVDMLKN